MISLFRPRPLRVKTRRGRSGAAPATGVLNALLGLAAPAQGTGTTADGKRKGAKATAAKPQQPPVPAHKGASAPRASFRAAVHTGEHGTLRYKIFRPASAAAAAKPPPLLVMLHGCGQTPDDFARGTGMNARAEAAGIIVVYPAQTRAAHPNRCWNWFRRADQGRGAGEPAMIASLTRHLVDKHGADPARVYVAGLSAGASTALILAHAYPELFAAVGAHSGLPVGAAHDKTSAVVAMQRGNPGLQRSTAVPTIIFHGSADHVVHPRNGRLMAIRALQPFFRLDSSEVTGRAAGGRDYVKTVHRVGRGRPWVEHWVVEGAGHAWSGGARSGRFTDAAGPDASAEMLRFFLRHKLAARKRGRRG